MSQPSSLPPPPPPPPTTAPGPRESKEEYWKWRAKNNPFGDPFKKDYKPGFFENRPGRRILLLYLPAMIGSIWYLRWDTRRLQEQGIGVISVHKAVIDSDESLGPF